MKGWSLRPQTADSKLEELRIDHLSDVWIVLSAVLLGLNGGNDHGVYDVINQCAATEVVDGILEALKDRADCHCASASLDRLVRIVPGV